MWAEVKAVALFCAVTLGLGHTILRLSQSAARPEHPVIRLVETAAIGVAAFSFLGVILGLFHVPLEPPVYLALSAIVPIASLVKALRARTPVRARAPAAGAPRWWKTPGTLDAALLLVLIGVLFAVYLKGAMAYAYLEDDDSWLHAEGALYIARVHTYAVDPALRPLGGFANYLEPYPPTYDVIMGLMRQANDSVYWTLKFFNVVIVTLAHAFCFLFFVEYLGNRRKALFATMVLVVLPSFMSHFIWSQSLALCVFPVAMFASLRALSDRTWIAPAILAIASMMVTQPIVSFVFGVAFLMLIASLFLDEARKAERVTLAACPRTVRAVLIGAAGLATSFLYWGAQIAKWGLGGIVGLKGDEVTAKGVNAYALQAYSLKDVLFPTGNARIDQGIGWGLAVSAALLAGLVASVLAMTRARGARARWQPLHLVTWFLFLAYAVFGPSLGLPAWGTCRAWGYAAIPVALLATEGVFFACRAVPWPSARWRESAIAGFAAVAVVVTCAPAKVALQTASWPPGVQWTYAPAERGFAAIDLLGFLKLRERLPRGTRVYSLCESDARAIGFDMDASPWAPSEAEFRRRGAEVSPDEALAFLDEHRYEYFTFDASCARTGRGEAWDRLVRGLSASGRVTSVLEERGFLLAQVSPSKVGAPSPGALNELRR
jgi:hypothetical protein